MGKEVEIKTQHVVPALNDSWHSFRREIERVFDRFSEGFESFSLQPFTRMQNLWSPGLTGLAPLAVDVAEDDKALTVTAELPGVPEKNVEVTVDDGLLMIKGEKRQEKEGKGKNHYLSERSYGAFQRIFSLPRGTDAAGIKAGFHNGILSVIIPKVARIQDVQKVEVKAA
jgi:HSP20 family protein